MSDLQVFGEAEQQAKLTTNDPAVIAAELAERGIGFERWPAREALSAGAGPEDV
ncbi:MAG: acireductone dioxygenase, partial [Synechococcaceae bacterium WB7_3xG_012]|nr:acireductone dioxygenase [Synechococcaceae bacterium WB7_3xG_012]